MSHGCKKGRTLRKLEVGEVIREGDLYLGAKWRPVGLVWWGYKWSSLLKPFFRPLTREEVEDYKRRMG